MGRRYYPSNDQEFRTWLANFCTQLAGNAAQVGLVAADVDPIANANDAFDAALTSHINAQLAARAASGAKFTSRTDAESILKPLVRRICNHPGMTEALRGILGLNQPFIPQAETPISLLKPKAALEPGQGQVIVHWGPEPGNEHINGKPVGVRGAIICRKKTNEQNYQMVGYATSSPFIDYLSGDAADYMYMVRYRGTKQTDVSEWSDPQIIAARGEQAA